MKQFLALLSLLFALRTRKVMGETDMCRYDLDRCSCKLGEESQGICWDPIPESPGRCRRRFCEKAWTCACGGRTHVCYRADTRALGVSMEDTKSSTALCFKKPGQRVTGREISLGSLKLFISPKGARANACLEVAIWHNGDLLGSFKPMDSSTSVDVVSEVSLRENHSLLELRGGDVLAWRFRDASYYCMLHRVEATVNGTSVDLNTPGVDLSYARAFSSDWFDPYFTPNRGTDESEKDLTKFIPLREQTYSGEVILPGKDYFQPADPTSPDHKLSNFYYRLQLPYSLTSTFAIEPPSIVP